MILRQVATALVKRLVTGGEASVLTRHSGSVNTFGSPDPASWSRGLDKTSTVLLNGRGSDDHGSALAYGC